jgi:hypothetical protein
MSKTGWRWTQACAKLFSALNSLLTGKNTGNSTSWPCQLGDNSTRQSALAQKKGLSRPIRTGNYQGMNRESKFPVGKKRGCHGSKIPNRGSTCKERRLQHHSWVSGKPEVIRPKPQVARASARASAVLQFCTDPLLVHRLRKLSRCAGLVVRVPRVARSQCACSRRGELDGAVTTATYQRS